jgi:hypothetical protein
VEKMKTKKHKAIVLSSGQEKETFDKFTNLLNIMPIPDEEKLANLGLFLTSKNLARILFFYEMYKKIVESHGVVMEFGVRWGQNLSLLSALRGIFEPFNRHRKIIGFDTFSGFSGISQKDGPRCRCSDGSFSVAENYEDYLENILDLQEKMNPMSHIKRFELVKGDATKTIPAYFKQHPETIVSLAIFDFDIYKPTKAALKAVKPHLAKGSVLVFDELCDDIFPGETIAVQEVFGINNLKVKRFPFAARVSYAEIK